MAEFTATELNTTTSPMCEQALMDLSVTLAHRIRSLVASIEGFTDLLTDSLATMEQREMALRILEGAARIERVLADLQLYSRPVEPVAVPLRITDVTGELLRFLDEVETELFEVGNQMDDRCAVMADPGLLNQALLILLRNAFEATGYESEVRMSICKVEDGGHARFDVWNKGEVELQDAETRIFTPFFTTKAQNLGIGLPVARRIAEAHGGSLSLSFNSAAEGTCFSLYIPMHDGPFASILDL